MFDKLPIRQSLILACIALFTCTGSFAATESTSKSCECGSVDSPPQESDGIRVVNSLWYILTGFETFDPAHQDQDEVLERIAKVSATLTPETMDGVLQMLLRILYSSQIQIPDFEPWGRDQTFAESLLLTFLQNRPEQGLSLLQYVMAQHETPENVADWALNLLQEELLNEQDPVDEATLSMFFDEILSLSSEHEIPLDRRDLSEISTSLRRIGYATLANRVLNHLCFQEQQPNALSAPASSSILVLDLSSLSQ